MGDTCDLVSPHQIDDSLTVNDVAHMNNTDKNLNKSGSQLKILDYYKPSPVKGNEIVNPVSESSSAKPKINSIAQSILEDVCNDFENFDVVFTEKLTSETDDNHSSSISESGNLELGHLVSETAQFSKSNDTSVDQLVFECEKVAVSNSADAFILKLVPGTSFGKGHAPILEEIINDPKKCRVAGIKVSSAFMGDESQSSTDISFEKINPADESFCSVSPQASNSDLENDSRSGMSSFTVTDSVTVLKNMPAQHIQFDVFEISDPYLVSENSICENDAEIEQEELLQSERQNEEAIVDCSSDVIDTKSISNNPIVTGVEQVVNAGVYVPTNVRNTKARRISAKMKKQWSKELEMSGHIICPMPGCHQKYVTVANFQTHYKWCTGKKTLQHCPYCESLIFAGHEAVLHHMVVEHPDKVEEYTHTHKDKCSSEDSLVPREDESVISSLKKHKPKNAKKRNFSLKENMLLQKSSLKDGLKIMERTMDKNYQEFKKCVRFNDIVQKINSVSEEVNRDSDELKNLNRYNANRFLKHKRKIILAESISSIDDLNFVKKEEEDDDDDESVDCPSHFNKSPRRVTTKSRIVLNTQGYKRFNESLKLTRDWACERKTYSRHKSADNSCNSCLDDTSSLLADVKDTYVLNDSSEQSGILLSVSDDENYCNGEVIPLESPVLQSCIKKVPGKAIEIHDKRTIKPRNGLDGSVVLSQVITEEKKEILLNSNEDKTKNIRPALTPEPTPEVNYGHLIFAKPSKIKTERFTCYDNVNNKLFCKEEFNNTNLNTGSVSKTEKLDEKTVCEKVSNVDFDSLISTHVEEYGRKRGRGRGRLSKNSIISEVLGQVPKKGKHRKEDGVKMPPVKVNCKEDGVKMPAVDANKVKRKRGRPPKYLKLESTPTCEVKMKRNHEVPSRKNVESNPIMYNESIKINVLDGDEALPCNPQNPPELVSVDNNHLGNENTLHKTRSLEKCATPEVELNCHVSAVQENTISKEMDFDFLTKSKDLSLGVEKKNAVCGMISATHVLSQLKQAENESMLCCSNMVFVPTLRCLSARVVRANYLFCKGGESGGSFLETKEVPYKSCISTNVLCKINSYDGERSDDLVKPLLNSTSENIVEQPVCDIYMQKLKPEVDSTKECGLFMCEEEKTINIVKELILDLKEKVIHFCKNNNAQAIPNFFAENSVLLNQSESSVTHQTNSLVSSVQESNFKADKPNNKMCDELNPAAFSNLSAKKRGRPPKVKRNHENCIEESASVSNELNSFPDADEELPAKRKRGRPRKSKSNISVSNDSSVQLPYSEDANITLTSCEASLNTSNCDPVADTSIPHAHDFLDRAVANFADVKETDTSCASSVENIQHNLSSSELSHGEIEENLKNQKFFDDSSSSVKLPAVRKSSRIRKHKVDPDAVVLLPKKNISSKKSLNQSSELNEQPLNQGPELGPSMKTEVIRTGKRGRPRKADTNTKKNSEECPDSKSNDSANLINDVVVPKDTSLNHTRKGARKGNPRKCVRYADLNSGIEDSPESLVVSNMQSCVTTSETTVPENQNDTTVLEADKCRGSLENKTSICANNINVAHREFTEEFSAVRAFMDIFNKSKNRRKLQQKLLKTIKLKNRRKKKMKLHKVRSACNSLPQKKSNLQMNSEPLQTSAINDVSYVPLEKNAMPSTIQVKEKKLTNKRGKNVRSAAVKARQLMENMIRIDGKIDNEVKKESKDDVDFLVPEMDDDDEVDEYENHEDELDVEQDCKTKLMKYKEFIELPEIEMPVATKELIADWQSKLETDEVIRCKREGCNKAFGTKLGMIYHYEVSCQRKLNLWRCTICEKKFKPYSVQLLNHMEKLHFPPGQITKQPKSTPKKRERKFSGSKEDNFQPSLHLIFAENSKIKSLENFKSVKSAFKFLDSNEYKEFIPLQVSMMIKTENVNLKNSVWSELPCFKSSFDKDDPRKVSFFVGGYVTSSAWCPTPYGSETTPPTQYICLATCSKFTDCQHSSNGLLKDENEIGLLQLYHVGNLTSDRLNQPPVFSLAIAHRHGLINSMVWCPNGCWEDPLFSVTDKSSDILPRLGVLAVACSDSFIRLYSIPHPENLKCPSGRLPIVSTQPCVLLHPVFGGKSSITQKAKCTSVSWKRTKNSDYIMGGYSNGLVVLWNITKCHKKTEPSQTHDVSLMNEKYVPFLTFQAHGAPVTCITFSPVSDQLFAATGSMDRTLKIWDLDDTSVPMHQYRKGIVRSIHWPLIWSGVFVSCDDGFNSKSTAYVDFSSMKLVRAIPSKDGSVNDSCDWSSSVSEWLNAAAVGSGMGNLSVTVLQKLNLSHYHAVHNAPTMPIFRTEVVSVEEDPDLCSAIVNKPAIIDTSHTFLPLSFDILPKKITRTKSHGTTEHVDLLNASRSYKFKGNVKNVKKINCDVVPCDNELNSGIAVSCHQTSHATTNCQMSEVLENILRTVDNMVSSEQHESYPNHTGVLKTISSVPQTFLHPLSSKPQLKISSKMNAQCSFASPVEKFVAMSKNYGLKFLDFEKGRSGKFSADAPKTVKNNESERNGCIDSCFNGFHLASIDSVQWNPNYEAHSWLYSVGESGIVRLINVAGLKQN